MIFKVANTSIDTKTIYKTRRRGDKYNIIADAGIIQVPGTINGRNIIRTHHMVTIKFIDTGTIKEVRLHNALKGIVRDQFARSFYGVGYLGNASSVDDMKAFSTWKSMIERCYCTTSERYPSYGGAGVRVCDRWQCFEYFLQDIPYVDGYNEWRNAAPGDYSIDKDIKQMRIPKSQRIYSKETCTFIPTSDNVEFEALEIDKKSTSTMYYGVKKRDSFNFYECEISLNNKKVYLGAYRDEIAAAMVYNYVLKSNKGNTLTYNKDIPEFDYNYVQAHYTGRSPITLPLKDECIILYPKGRKYTGFYERNGAYVVSGGKNGTYISQEAAATVYNYTHRILKGKPPVNYVTMTLAEALSERLLHKGLHMQDMCVYRRDLSVNPNQYYTPHDTYCDQFGNIMQPTAPGQVVQQHQAAPAVSSQMNQMYQVNQINQPIQPAAFTYDYYQPVYGYGYNYPQNQLNRPIIDMCRIVK